DGDWHWRPGFNPAAVQTIQLLDRSMDQGRVGDALKVNYVEADGKIHLRVTFEYCEGEHYYKYSGWQRIWTIHTLYEEPLDRASPGAEAAADGRSQLGLPALWSEERGRTGRLLVLRGRNQSLCLRPGPWLRFADLAVPAMPRMEQHNPPLVLVVREHAEQTAEARRVISE